MSYQAQLEAISSLVELWPCGDSGTPLGDTQSTGNDLAFFTNNEPASYQQTTLIPYADTGCVTNPTAATAFFYKASPTASIQSDVIKTVHAWVNPAAISSGDNIVSIDGGTNKLALWIDNGGSGAAQVIASWTTAAGTVSGTTDSAVVSAGSTYMIVATQSGTIGVDATVDIYVNDTTPAVTVGTTATTAFNTRVAFFTSGGGSNQLGGSLQMVALFDAALDSTTIANLYDYGINGPSTGGIRNRITRGKVNHRGLVRF